jgi:hypothetical protein
MRRWEDKDNEGKGYGIVEINKVSSSITPLLYIFTCFLTHHTSIMANKAGEVDWRDMGGSSFSIIVGLGSGI